MALVALDQPLPASLSARQARDAYLAENGFTVEAYDAKWTDASFLGVRFAVPNTAAHRRAIMLHDLHHVVTGYGTDLAGEGEISAWELRRGLRGVGSYVSAIIVAGALMGLLVSPRRTLAAWRTAGSGGSLFRARRSYEELLRSTVGELRAELAIPPRGVLERPRRLHAHAPAFETSGTSR